MRSFTATASIRPSWLRFIDLAGVSMVVKDQGRGFGPDATANPLSTENFEAECGRGLLLMCSQMDEVFLDSGGKQSPHAQEIPTSESRAVLD